MQLYTVTVPAADEPVTLAEAKAFMRVTSSAEDTLITTLISSATETLEQYTNRYFVVRTVQGDFSTVLVSKTEVYPYVVVGRAELQTVTSVEVSVNGSFEAESFQIKKPTHGFSRILFDDLTDQLDDIPYPLQIIFTAGYGDASNVPDNIKVAIMEYVSFLYRNRGDCIDKDACSVLQENDGIPPIVRNIMARYRIIEVYA